MNDVNNPNIPDEERIYTESKETWCRKTTKESGDRLFKILGLDLVDGEIIHIEKPESEPVVKPETQPPQQITQTETALTPDDSKLFQEFLIWKKQQDNKNSIIYQ